MIPMRNREPPGAYLSLADLSAPIVSHPHPPPLNNAQSRLISRCLRRFCVLHQLALSHPLIIEYFACLARLSIDSYRTPCPDAILLATELLAIPTSAASVEGLISTPTTFTEAAATAAAAAAAAARKQQQQQPLMAPHSKRPQLARSTSAPEPEPEDSPLASPNADHDEEEEEVPLPKGKAGILIDARREGEALVNGKRKLRREGSGTTGRGGGGTVIGDIGGRVRRLWRKLNNGEGQGCRVVGYGSLLRWKQ